MAIGANSYSTPDDVLAFTRHLLDGESGFNSTTRPSLTEVEGMIDRASAALNLALCGEGLRIPITQADAKLACDEWTTARVVGMVELTRQAQGWSGDAGSRAEGFLHLVTSAQDFAAENGPAFKRIGCAVADVASEGLAFVGDAAQSARFCRAMFMQDQDDEEA